MDQQRTTLFVPGTSFKKTSPDTKCYFLELPLTIRRQIYHEAGLLSGKTINMNSWALRKQAGRDDISDHSYDSDLPCVPLCLFATCRLVNDELTGIFYGENQFTITRRENQGFRALECLSDQTLTRIRSLNIRLNLESCPNACCGYWSRTCGNGQNGCPTPPTTHDTPLNHLSISDQLIISQWQQISARLLTSAQPGKLALYVICDCEDIQTANIIVEPLLALPILHDFGLRLAKEKNTELQGLAKRTALRLTGRLTPQSLLDFRFLDLPKEIQLQILGHTSLVHNRNTICGRRYMGYSGSCSTHGNASSIITHDSLVKCFCGGSHSAFNFFCDHCEDLAFPHALFLVNREFRDAAVEVFYGRNEFIVQIMSRDDDGISIIPTLENFPRYALRFFTSLCLFFPRGSGLEALQPNHKGWNIWLKQIDLLLEEANLRVLTIEIRLTERFFSRGGGYIPSDYEEHMRDTYYRFIQPVTGLGSKGLKNLFVYLDWRNKKEYFARGKEDERQELEQKLERMVMGNNYNAWRCGKKVQR